MNKAVEEKIAALLANGRAVVAIDGRCASGKSTLADEIKSVFGGTVIRADSFFLPASMRSEERLSQPGGNFHYERFRSEVIGGINSRLPFSYGVYDCSSGCITHSLCVDEPGLITVEGSYCMHPALNADYDLCIFCTTDEETQLDRIRKRNGEEVLKIFKEKWIPLENSYIDYCKTADKCQIILST